MIPHQHQILQWAGWWAAQIIYRYAIRHHGRTSYEYVTGHKTKAPITTFGEKILWRKRRHSAELNKHDSEWSEGIFIGLSCASVLVSCPPPIGIVSCRDIRRLPEQDRWDKKMLLECTTSFEEYVDPARDKPEPTVVRAEVSDEPVEGAIEEPLVGARRM